MSGTVWLALCHDAPGAPALRREHLAAHLAHVAAHIADYAVAGPLSNAPSPGGETTGSALAVRAPDAAAARAFIETDPYARAGVWARIDIFGWKPVAGGWVGGITW